ncbi:hypothetical protein DFP73DRAFT_590158 [Morchella snyderi]|nr:hypothetical protein DFP73DRAFT_590158 [Morchella snyderi]
MAQPIRPGRQERQAPPGQNDLAWGPLSIAITPDAARAGVCAWRCQSRALAPGNSFNHPAPPEKNALPEQTVRVRRFQSSMLAFGAARAECSFPPLPEPCARVRHYQCSVLASGGARAEYLFPPLHATSPSQSTGLTQYRRIHPPSGHHSPMPYSPAAARASYLHPLGTP